MIKIWGNIIRKNKISAAHMVEIDAVPSVDVYLAAIREICEKLDLEMPVILSKHKNDMDNFSLVRFLPSDFIEKVDFQRFDIEIFVEKDKKNNT